MSRCLRVASRQAFLIHNRHDDHTLPPAKRLLQVACCLQVNRLELTLSIGSFAAGLGAMIAGIFGMNLTSTWEASVVGFWGMTGLIMVGCVWVVWALYSYTRRRRIL